MHGICIYITCIGVLVLIVLTAMILNEQKKCGCGEGYREYSGGFSGTTAASEWK